MAEFVVQFPGIKEGDPSAQMKVVGWGNLAQDLQNRVQPGQRLVLEGRLRMSTFTRQDGIKEKRAEFTLARLHPLAPGGSPQPAAAATAAAAPAAAAPGRPPAAPARAAQAAPVSATPSWNAAPLVPDLADGDDDIPF